MVVVRHFILHLLLPVLALAALGGCETTGGNSAQEQARAARIATEPPGNYWIGRRYFTEKTRFWGYVRRPGAPWSDSQLVVMNEAMQNVPDRLPEVGTPGGNAFGYDHNHEYRITGRLSGDTVYDPNSNAVLPEFVPSGFELINESPGWLFDPNEAYNPERLPSRMY